MGRKWQDLLREETVGLVGGSLNMIQFHNSKTLQILERLKRVNS